ncbi:MAG: cbb3-type cytochrome c oxidase subunit I [Syntrophothermus sp.]
MFRWLFRKFMALLPFSKQRRSRERSRTPREGVQEKEIAYPSQRVAYKYCVGAALFFAFQVVLATLASLELVFPDLPAPLPVNFGRSIHVNLSQFWPLLGIMGGIYYVLPEEIGDDLYSPFLANLQFWLMIATMLGIIGTLALGYTTGREYLEPILPLKLAQGLALLIFTLNVTITLFKRRFAVWHPTSTSILLGLGLSMVLYFPTLLFFKNLVADEFFKFWTVHIWWESSLELIVTGLLTTMLILMTRVDPGLVMKYYYLEAILVILLGFYGVGHHYFWIGLQKYWVYIGGIFGALQAVPLFFIVWVAYTATLHKKGLTTNNVAFKFLWAAAIWNLVGAGLLGAVTTIPQINVYTHGTYLVSSHAHLALFGTYGSLALAVIYFVLVQWQKLEMLSIRAGEIAFWLINTGLAIMAAALGLAGIVQAYLWRFVGLDFATVQGLLRPYMAARSAGAAMFAIGAIIPAWDIAANLIFPLPPNARDASHN